ncbi:hypothetical protein F5Y10DRAFT_173798 [Nemania abortiva]|nr:hypothetical protein F5Y10DRAFT_173798 [Nemania abortiva]
MGAHFSHNHFQVNGRTVLITGANRGLGLEVGRQLAKKGANIIIVARDQQRLETGIKYVEQGAANPATQRFLHINADLTIPSESTRIMSEASRWNNGSPPDIVWCCVGRSHPAMFIDTSAADLQSQMDVNYFSSAYMAHAALKAWMSPNDETGEPGNTKDRPLPRHIIFTSTFCAFYTFAGWGAYSPAKSALRSLADTLSQEMQLYSTAYPKAAPIRIHAVFPAKILTESFEAEEQIKPALTIMLESPDKGQTAQEAAAASIRGLEAGQEMVVTTFVTRLALCGMLGGSYRGGFWRGLVDWLMACVMGLGFVLIRLDTDLKIRQWGRKHGPSGKLTVN